MTLAEIDSQIEFLKRKRDVMVRRGEADQIAKPSHAQRDARIRAYGVKKKSDEFADGAWKLDELIYELTRGGKGIDDIQVDLKLKYGITCDRLQIKKIVLRQQ